jgi:hypothetical protein
MGRSRQDVCTVPLTTPSDFQTHQTDRPLLAGSDGLALPRRVVINSSPNH